MKPSFLQRLFSPSIVLLLKRLGIVFLLLTVTRLVFFLLNRSYFQEATALDFILGLRFDASSVAYLFSLFIVLSLFPYVLVRHAFFRWLQAFSYFIPLSICLLMNLSDAVYFRFIFRRSTIDVTRYFSSASGDGWRLLGTFALGYWYIVLLFLIFLGVAVWLYRKAASRYETNKEGGWIRFVALLFFSGLIILAGRGGLQLVPISLLDAGLHTAPSSLPLVLNTPFSMMITAFQPPHQPVYYYKSTQEAEKLFSVDYTVHPHPHVSFKGRNIVLIILESFGQEYVGFYNKNKTYTPVLDSLLKNSYVFVNAFANGKQSVDAVPALLSGIPSMMHEPFTASPYAGNRLPSLAMYFKQQGYRTQFFHGGVNGTMGFEAFATTAGVDQYLGKNQYPQTERDYDGNWGIFDEPYLKYVANELTKNKSPFFSTVFTLSSHHPYTIPKPYEGRFPKGTYEIHESIGYADYALGEFFKEAKKQPWFDNTLFVLTADHTGHSDFSFYREGMGKYAVPIAFYDPQQRWKGIDSTVIQHLDLFPTLISLTGGEVNGKFFGRNAFDDSTRHDVLNYFYGGLYNYLDKPLQAIFNGTSVEALYAHPEDTLQKNNLLKQRPSLAAQQEAVIKAKIQAYYQHMEGNSLFFEMKK